MINQEEQNYLDLLKNILENGSKRNDRTGVGTYSLFGTQLKFSLENNIIPMITTKKMFSKGVIEELLFFLRGETDSKILEAKGVNIWKGNTSREFLDKRGLAHYAEGEMGPMYGAQWRYSGKHINYYDNSIEPGIDQIANVINLLKNDPYSRRIVVNSWIPDQIDYMVLAPCHPMFQFYVDNNKLSCLFVMRSADVFLGMPFNILSYGILTHIIAKTINMEAKELIFMGADTHIYQNHIEQTKEQISRAPFDFPTLTINKQLSDIKDIESLELKDFEIKNYQSHPAIKAEMAI